jgi:nucleoside-specific outer membrane channel protein Tsx
MITYKSGSTTTQALYSGFGYHLGLGIDIPLGSNMFVSPVAYYEKADLTQKDTTAGSRRIEEGGILLGAGLRF